MKNNMKKSFTKSLLAISIASASTVTQASSFALIEQSASGQGASYAGASAIAEDASTIYFNPAGMTRLSGKQIVVAGHIILPDASFTNNGSTTFAGSPLSGADSDTGDAAFVPNFYYSAELNNDIFVGVGVTVPFGLSTEYDDGWVGRYHALLSEISTININPSIAWKATDTVSVGFGISVQYAELELTNNIDSFAACANLDPTLASCAGLTAAPGVASQDSKVTLDGDSLEFGWNAGVLIELPNNDRLGIAYRSSVKHEVSGNANYELNAGLAPVAAGASTSSGFNILQDTSLDATAELPDSFSVSYVRELDSQWTILADWTWTGWSGLDTVTIIQAGGVPGQEPTLDLAYANSNRYAVGVHYKRNNQWVYRGGLAFDETPIRSAEQTSARIPGNDRTWLSFGVGYKHSADLTFDVGYSHLFISDTDINNLSSTSSGATLMGSYESSVDILSAQANFNF